MRGRPGAAPFRSPLKEEFSDLWQGKWLADSLQGGWLLHSDLGYLAKTVLFSGPQLTVWARRWYKGEAISAQGRPLPMDNPCFGAPQRESAAYRVAPA